MPSIFQDLTNSGNWNPALPVEVIALLAGTAAVVTLVRAVQGRPLPFPANAATVLFRLTSVTLLAWILLNPSQNVTLPKAGSNRTIVLLDDSASMTLAAAAGQTRWQDAETWIREAAAAMESANGTVCEVRTFSAPGIAGKPNETRPLPTTQETRLSAALQALASEAGTRAPDQIIVVSDGAVHDRAGLATALSALRQAGISISAKSTGIDEAVRNASLATVQPPRVARPGARIVVPFEVTASGYPAGTQLSVTVADGNGNEAGRQEIQLPSTSGGPVQVPGRISFDASLHTQTWTLQLAGPAGEVTLDDNIFHFTVEIISTKLRVLMVEGTHVKRSVGTSGHWLNDIELMTSAWDATGEIEWECLTPISEYVDQPNLVGVKQFVNGEMLLDKSRTFPQTADEIHQFDVMLISDVPVGNFSEEQMQIVSNWVTERGGGFMMGGGYTSFDVGNYDKTPWEKIIPVDMLEYGDGFFEHAFSIAIPPAVRSHPIWQISPDPVENAEIIASHPQFTGMNRVRRAKPGALVMAVRPEAGDEPVFALQNYGRGRSIAYLSDPNGGWARNTVSWGPPGGPVQGPHTELGHGENFIFNEEMARAASGPRPPHPAPWYGQFWVNMVKWLGGNSIRWQRDQFQGRIITAQASPGADLPVAAEVLSITSPEELRTLDVGARLDLPGSPRVRLQWDRDLREFRGSVRVPTDFTAKEARVVFDTVAGRGTLTDMASAGLRRESREFAASAPDIPLLQDLAMAGGGSFLTAPGDAATAALAAAKARESRESRTFSQPVWTRWPIWTALLFLLGLEWLIRRRCRLATFTALNPEPIPTPG